MRDNNNTYVRPQRKREGLKILALSKMIVFPIDHVSMTSVDSYRCDSFCLAQVFQNLPAPPKHYGAFDVFADFQSFFQLENPGSHMAKSLDDRFQPQDKQILAKKLLSAIHALVNVDFRNF